MSWRNLTGSRISKSPIPVVKKAIKHLDRQQIPPATPQINRLRAAAALIPIIEAGLADSKLSVERAALMASFCEWAVENVPDDPDMVKLAQTVGNGLKRIEMALSSVA